MTAPPDIARLEELVLGSTPCTQEQLLDGWRLRLAPNDIKRVRSVTAIANTSGDINAKIESCERLYAERGLPALFRLSPASQPPTLDAQLAARGYAIEEPTLMQVRDLSGELPAQASEWQVSCPPLETWVEAVAGFRRSTPVERGNHLQRMERLGPSATVIGVFQQEEMIGSGSVVIEGDWASVIDMHTREDYRGRGVGGAILGALLRYAHDHAASKAWLGVLEENGPARGLYAKFGFETAYKYWYRVKPG